MVSLAKGNGREITADFKVSAPLNCKSKKQSIARNDLQSFA